MKQRVLITGGAGFIGSHLADELLSHGYEVRALDNLDPQVHGPSGNRPDYLDKDVELLTGDVRDPASVRGALKDVDMVVHFAARVGVGQSMYEIEQYTDVNNRGTAVLLQELIEHPVKRFIVASSMSIYGEGLYKDADGNIVSQAGRTQQQLREGKWEVSASTGEPLNPIPTPETKQPTLASIYALSKYDQEMMCLITGRTYGIPTIALRFFNIYGTRQALSNPYTGVLAIFGSRLLNNRPPLVFEDGRQQRDFVSIYDIVQGCRLALEAEHIEDEVFNIGSGRSISIADIAGMMADAAGKEHLTPTITGKFRAGDIRHCYADISKASAMLGYQPRVKLEDGLRELVDWLDTQVAHDRTEEAAARLAAYGLTK